MTSDRMLDAIVLGAGPAGATAALGLAGLGHRVALISERRAASVEGLSARALAGLEDSGVSVAFASELSPRRVSWTGQTSMRGHESVVLREELDGCLLRSVQSRGIACVDSTARNVRLTSEGWHIDTNGGSFQARSVLDARGRRARRSDARGPLLVAWSQILGPRGGGANDSPASAVVALEDGWCWLARAQDGTVCLQFVGSATDHLQPGQVATRFAAAAESASGLDFVTETAGFPATALVARAAVARYSRPSQGPGFLRIGDAAVAMDPLSGNGVHEAVRSARVGVAAINSYLGGMHWPEISQFVDERARELWRRSVSSAAQFYRLQADHSGGVFWNLAASAYEQSAREATVRYEGPGRFEMRPVLDGQQIEVRRVWVSAEWPRGVWQVNGRPLDQLPAGLVPSILRRAAGISRYEV